MLSNTDAGACLPGPRHFLLYVIPSAMLDAALANTEHRIGLNITMFGN
jgi:hypothetical protein